MDWDEYFLNIAKTVAERSKDPFDKGWCCNYRQTSSSGIIWLQWANPGGGRVEINAQ